MKDREKHLKMLEKMFYSMEKLESGVILPTSEVKTALAFAISSIKTDLKYDLLYEGEDELCNGDCDNCDFVDGDYCRFNEKSIPVNLHVTEIKKHQSDFSDLGGDNNVTSTDCISRQEAIDTIRQLYLDLATQKYVIDLLKVLPSVTPQERKGHWIGCKCDKCGYGVQPWNTTNYCPNCGSRNEVEV